MSPFTRLSTVVKRHWSSKAFEVVERIGIGTPYGRTQSCCPPDWVRKLRNWCYSIKNTLGSSSQHLVVRRNHSREKEKGLWEESPCSGYICRAIIGVVNRVIQQASRSAYYCLVMTFHMQYKCGYSARSHVSYQCYNQVPHLTQPTG